MSRAPIRTAIARGTRTSIRQRGHAPLEALAAEFALLAQRRGRVRRQIDLLERQRIAADTTLRLVEQRMAVLSGRMHRVPLSPPDVDSAPLEATATPRPTSPTPRGRRGLVLEY